MYIGKKESMSKNKFVIPSKLNLSDVNKEILSQWTSEDLFGKSLKARKGARDFVFFEGPPSANGHPGIYHVLARTIKDTDCLWSLAWRKLLVSQKKT